MSTEDQFGPRTLRVTGARELFVPTQKLVGDLEFPDRLNHYWCYEIFGPQRTVAQTFGVLNQFEQDVFTITSHQLLCVPAEKLGFTPVAR